MKKIKKVLVLSLASLAILGLSTTAFSAPLTSPISSSPTQGKTAFLVNTTSSGWTSGSITNVTLTKNKTIYNDDYLKDQIKKDSFSAKFKVYAVTGKFFSPMPTHIRMLYGTTLATTSELIDGQTYVIYTYYGYGGLFSEDYEAEVTVVYDIK